MTTELEGWVLRYLALRSMGYGKRLATKLATRAGRA
jgi:hypothetical protein